MGQTLYPDVANKLIEAGYELCRQTGGSHKVFKKPNNRNIIVSYNIRDKNLAKKLLKQAGCHL
jgi:predicted RNA binding protein YcfA (HicA-like mRNA interferase family)